jgi:hypothetical protein
MAVIKNKFGYLCNVERYDSPEEYADFIESIRPEFRNDYYDEYRSRIRGSFKEAIQGLRYGDLALVEQAEKIMDKLRYEGIMSTGLPMPSRAVTGAMTILPLYNAGIPNCMVTRNMGDIQGVNAPLNIYWDRFRSGMLDGDAVVRRGIAITAFVMAMNNIRPVNLYFISASCPHNATGYERGLYGGLIRMETRPLDLARACWIFTNRHFSGPLTFMSMKQRFWEATKGYKYPDDARGPLWLRSPANSAEYEAEHRDILDMQGDDIFLHGMHAHETLSHTDPVAWVKKMIEQHITKQET